MTTNQRIRLGDLLIDKQIISPEQLAAALQQQQQTGQRLGRALVEMGVMEEAELQRILAKHLNLQFIDLELQAINSSLAAYVPENLARRYRALPIRLQDEQLIIGLADPTDLTARDALRQAIKHPLQFAVIRESQVVSEIERLYGQQGEIRKLAGALEGSIQDSDFDLANLAANSSGEDLPVVKLLQQILQDAVSRQASDIHIEPDEHSLRVRMRVDGHLQEQIINEKRIAKALVVRLKLMAQLNISERRLPQDGRASIRVQDRNLDIRMATLPTIHGEAMVLRLLDQSAGILNLGELGMSATLQRQFKRMLARPHGLILVTGPTGSGKTTTLYAALNHLNIPDRKIITVEDPIEYRLSRINQVQVNTQVGLDFPRVLRSVLRHDPDVILVGEMRDQETVTIGVRAALTGHLVLSTLHTNDAIASALRLADMGVEPWLSAGALRGVLAQRLVRKLCPHCKAPAQLDAGQKAWLHHLQPGAGQGNYWQANGCSQCNNTGYKGRQGVYEMLELSPELLDAMRNQQHKLFHRLAEEAAGYRPLALEALALADQGLTDVQEVLRLVSDLGEPTEQLSPYDRLEGQDLALVAQDIDPEPGPEPRPENEI